MLSVVFFFPLEAFFSFVVFYSSDLFSFSFWGPGERKTKTKNKKPNTYVQYLYELKQDKTKSAYFIFECEETRGEKERKRSPSFQEQQIDHSAYSSLESLSKVFSNLQPGFYFNYFNLYPGIL